MITLIALIQRELECPKYLSYVLSLAYDSLSGLLSLLHNQGAN